MSLVSVEELNTDRYAPQSWAQKVSSFPVHLACNASWRILILIFEYDLGSDLALIRLLEGALRSAKWRTQVDTGRYTFPLGNNSRNVDDQSGDGHDGMTFHVQSQQDVAGVVQGFVDEL